MAMLKIMDRVELLSVISIADMVSGSRLMSNQNASFKPDKIKSKIIPTFTCNLKKDTLHYKHAK